MEKVRYVEKPRTVQTSVTISDFLKVIRDAARIYVRHPGGAGVSGNEFFATAAGEKATAILKEVGLYDAILENYVNEYGPVEEYGTGIQSEGQKNGVTEGPDVMYAEGQDMPETE